MIDCLIAICVSTIATIFFKSYYRITRIIGQPCIWRFSLKMLALPYLLYIMIRVKDMLTAWITALPYFITRNGATSISRILYQSVLPVFLLILDYNGNINCIAMFS